MPMTFWKLALNSKGVAGRPPWEIRCLVIEATPTLTKSAAIAETVAGERPEFRASSARERPSGFSHNLRSKRALLWLLKCSLPAGIPFGALSLVGE